MLFIMLITMSLFSRGSMDIKNFTKSFVSKKTGLKFYFISNK